MSGAKESSEAEELRRGFRKLEAKKLRHLRHVDQEEVEDFFLFSSNFHISKERGSSS